MQTVTEKHSNGSTTYKIHPVSGTAYYINTPQEVVDTIERLMNTKQRIKLYYGDENGRDWVEENDMRGTIGRSTGNIKIPLLIPTKRSYGGGAILCDKIIKIKDVFSNRIEYIQKNYQEPTIEVVPSDMEGYSHNTIVNGELYGRHKTYRSAMALKSKLS